MLCSAVILNTSVHGVSVRHHHATVLNNHSEGEVCGRGNEKFLACNQLHEGHDGVEEVAAKDAPERANN